MTASRMPTCWRRIMSPRCCGCTAPTTRPCFAAKSSIRFTPAWPTAGAPDRVFLAGDAAHLTPPFAGQGMNSGVRDAHNLAWKLAAVVSGHLGDKLLDSYEAERRDHAAEMIQLAIRMGHVMMPRGRWQALAVRRSSGRWRCYPAARSYFAEMKYKPKPTFHRGFLLAPNSPVQTIAGRQAVSAGAGDDGFRLCAARRRAGRRFRAAGAAGNAAKRSPCASRRTIGPAHPRAWRCWTRRMRRRSRPPLIAARDLRGDLARLLAGYPAGLYLLRPDRYVAAFFPVADAASAPAGISRLTGETRSGT